jgi:hypothetical protein
MPEIRRIPSSRITRWAAVLAAVLAIFAFRADAASPVRLQWEGLSIVVGKTVSIAMPGGSAVTGKAIGVESDALLVDVKGTTDAKAYPKGLVRVPRATLHRFDMQTKGKAFRILGTFVGSAGGLAGGLGAAIGIQGGIFDNKNQGQAAAALCGIWAGGTVVGYLAGNAADKHWTPVEILQ